MIEKAVLQAKNKDLALEINNILLQYSQINNFNYKIVTSKETYQLKSNECLFNLIESKEEIDFNSTVTENSPVSYIGCKSQNTVNLDHIQIALIGYQRHLETNSKNLNTYNQLSLGQLNDSIHKAEPWIRDSKLAFFNLNAVRKSDLYDSDFAYPSGLSSESFTQLFRYAGMAEGLNRCFILNASLQNAHLIAQCIWYFVEAAQIRTTDHPYYKNSVSEFIVETNNFNEPLSFYKSSLTSRWWLKVPEIENNRWISVSYEDYLDATRDEISDRIMDAIMIE